MTHHARRIACAAALLAAAVLAPGAAARPVYGGKACALLAAKQLSPFGVAASCKPLTTKGPGFTTSYATWGKALPPHLALTITTFTSTSSLIYRLKLREMKALGTKVSGIGSTAYEQARPGSPLAIIDFVVGKQFVTIDMAAKAPLASVSAFNALAKTVAGKL